MLLNVHPGVVKISSHPDTDSGYIFVNPMCFVREPLYGLFPSSYCQQICQRQFVHSTMASHCEAKSKTQIGSAQYVIFMFQRGSRKLSKHCVGIPR